MPNPPPLEFPREVEDGGEGGEGGWGEPGERGLGVNIALLRGAVLEASRALYHEEQLNG